MTLKLPGTGRERATLVGRVQELLVRAPLAGRGHARAHVAVGACSSSHVGMLHNHMWQRVCHSILPCRAT